jgi:hypothetical protein
MHVLHKFSTNLSIFTMKTINRYIAHYNNNRFSRQTAFIYVILTSKSLAQLSAITFDSIYRYCCRDSEVIFQFKHRDRAVKQVYW